MVSTQHGAPPPRIPQVTSLCPAALVQTATHVQYVNTQLTFFRTLKILMQKYDHGKSTIVLHRMNILVCGQAAVTHTFQCTWKANLHAEAKSYPECIMLTYQCRIYGAKAFRILCTFPVVRGVLVVWWLAWLTVNQQVIGSSLPRTGNWPP